MIKLGITGGIGSGKTIVCKVFNCLGVPVFNSDFVARNVVDQEQSVIQKIKSEFGTDIYSNDFLDRKKLSKLVFENKSALECLNAIVHPVVKKKFEFWLLENRNSPFVIKEAAILFESGAFKEMDKIATVYAPESIRLKRVINRDNITAELIKKRIENQISEQEKIKRSDFVIINDDDQLVLPQIIKIHQELGNKYAL